MTYDELHSYRVLVVCDEPIYIEREILIEGPAGATPEQVHRTANRWLASDDCPTELQGYCSAGPEECFDVS